MSQKCNGKLTGGFSIPGLMYKLCMMHYAKTVKHLIGELSSCRNGGGKTAQRLAFPYHAQDDRGCYALADKDSLLEPRKT